MKIKITLDNLNDAIKQIEALKTKVENFTADLAEDAKSGIGYSSVSVNHSGENHSIIAEDDNIAFAEFGAGYMADTVDGFSRLGGDDFVSYPGIWSESHGRTFQHHQASGKDPSTYKYNRRPLRYMESTALRLHQSIEQKAREYFK